MIECIKALYDWGILSRILSGNTSISAAKINQYDLHKKNLAILRRYLKKYLSKEEYKQFFDSKDGGNNYSNLIGNVTIRGKKNVVKRIANEDDFYKELKNLIIKTNCAPEDSETKNYLLESCEMHDLLPLQRGKDNSVIPKQINENELAKILEKASMYLPFLSAKDSDGITTSEKIVSIFNFRIPYYVGPLSDRHRNEGANNWAVRKEEGYIYPWNIENKIDFDKSNQAFIQRMTNKCTYLIGEDVVPKSSLIYSEYMVLNELNNIKIRGKKLPIAAKHELIDELYLKKNKVKIEDICKYLRREDASLQNDDFSGFADSLKASMTSYLDFSRKVFKTEILGDSEKQMAESIIKWITIYGDDRKMLKHTINETYPGVFSTEQLKAICTLKYSGWGNFSAKFLCGISGTNKDTGEIGSILDALRNTQDNLMQVLSERYTFAETIKAYNSEKTGTISKFTYEEIVKDLYVSPAVKRPIWQSLLIMNELTKVMGCPPKKIFVEMAREHEDDNTKAKNKNSRNSRKQKLLDLYANCKDDTRDWYSEIDKHDERDFNSMKLYLYYTQMGRCMYTGEAIDLDELMTANSRWDRDHIYPQSRIKDDSIDNLVLVNKTANNKKDNEMLKPEIREKMKGLLWSALLSKGMISKSKYDRLTRTEDFSDDELAGFISRQLVETRQASKIVADLLGNLYPDTKIVYVKAGLTSDFRHKTIEMPKSRLLNDYHHAKDAYLNIVVGNVYNTKFTDNPIRWIKDNRNTNYSLNRVFDYDVKDSSGNIVWKGNGQNLQLIKNTMNSNNVLYTEYTYCEKGELFKANPLSKSSTEASVPIKEGLSIEKYGGYKCPTTSYFAQIEFDGKKGARQKHIVGVPVFVANMMQNDPSAFLDYCDNKGFRNAKIIHPHINKNSLIILNGYPMRLRSDKGATIGLKNNLQLIVNSEQSECIRKVEKFCESQNKEINSSLDKLYDEDLINLYETLTAKLNGPYTNRPSNQYAGLIEKRDTFEKLPLIQKVKTVREIMNQFTCSLKMKSNLDSIGLKSGVGEIAIRKNTLSQGSVYIVNQSVTGIYENRIKL